MKQILLILIASVFLTLGCTQSSIEDKTVVLPYKAFGPPSMSGHLLGVEWFQWQSHGDSRPREYPIKVVVYKDASLEELEAAYPIDEALEKDFRYVEYTAAINYFDKNVLEVEEMAKEGYPMGNLSNELEETKSLIVKALSN
ncbi:hypothetical protein [Agarivorans aestuarii]|uniref:hypothetical protein n=1 Tax=Agarivorans aestuarii TaxID=1563703 RepID=UPI001C80CBCC|nr:hypothetical protein [Agarivorans aestuarii]